MEEIHDVHAHTQHTGMYNDTLGITTDFGPGFDRLLPEWTTSCPAKVAP